MKRTIDRLLTPSFEALVRRFDPAVTLDDHLAFLRRVGAVPDDLDALHGGRISRSLGCSLVSLRVDRSATAEDAEPHEAFGPAATSLCASALELEAGAAGRDGAAFDAVEAARFDWLGSPEPACRSAWACLDALRDATTDRVELAERVRALCDGLPPRQWFVARRGCIYGTSALLRAAIGLVQLDAADSALRGYVLEVVERLLKHVEVRREAALRLAPGGPPRASQPLERIRFTLALLEAAGAFADLRLLNAALKRNDIHLTELARRGRPRDHAWWLELACHAESLAIQEQRLCEVFPR